MHLIKKDRRLLGEQISELQFNHDPTETGLKEASNTEFKDSLEISLALRTTTPHIYWFCKCFGHFFQTKRTDQGNQDQQLIKIEN